MQPIAEVAPTTLARRVVACLDVANGRVVKGVRFADLRDAGDPAAAAARYEREGIDEIVLLDIAATPEGREALAGCVAAVAESLAIPFTVGGGVRRLGDIERLLAAGADKVSVNSAALDNPGLLGEAARRWGSQCVVVAIDARRRAEGGWEAMSAGGRRASGREAVAWAREAVEHGAGEILLTSMDADGTGDGYDLALTGAVADVVNVPVIASGGGGTPAHLADALAAGAQAVLAASIFHFGTCTVAEVKRAIASRGLPVRLV